MAEAESKAPEVDVLHVPNFWFRLAREDRIKNMELWNAFNETTGQKVVDFDDIDGESSSFISYFWNQS